MQTFMSIWAQEIFWWFLHGPLARDYCWGHAAIVSLPWHVHTEPIVQAPVCHGAGKRSQLALQASSWYLHMSRTVKRMYKKWLHYELNPRAVMHIDARRAVSS